MRGSQAQHVVSQVQDDDQATFALLPVVVAWGMAATCTSSFSSSTAAAVFNGMLVSFSTFAVSDAHMSLYLPDCLLRHLPRHKNTSTPLTKTRSGKNRSGRRRYMARGQVRIVGSSIKFRFPGRGIRFAQTHRLTRYRTARDQDLGAHRAPPSVQRSDLALLETLRISSSYVVPPFLSVNCGLLLAVVPAL